jgi:dihydrofolate reductase
MGKLIVTTHTTLDGVIGPGPTWARIDEGVQAHSFDQLRGAAGLVQGRTTFEGLARVWADSPDDTGFAARLGGLPKHVVSRTLGPDDGPLPWNGTLVEGDPAATLRGLAAAAPGNLLSYGCGSLARWMVEAGLVDEVHLWIHPVVVGEGERLFAGHPVRLALLSATTFASGVVLSAFRPIT